MLVNEVVKGIVFSKESCQCIIIWTNSSFTYIFLLLTSKTIKKRLSEDMFVF